MEDENPISGGELSSQLTGLNKEISSQRKKLIIISSIVFAIIVLIVIIIIIVSSSSSSSSSGDDSKQDDESNKEKVKQGEINCVYDVKSTTRNTILFSNEFKKDSDFDIQID